MNEPGTETLASVLASVIGSDRSREEIQAYTGLAPDAVDGAVRHLVATRLIHALDGRRYHATQGVCAGPCSRGGRTVRGTEVVINPATLRWMCAPCWDGPAARAPTGDATPAATAATDEPQAPPTEPQAPTEPTSAEQAPASAPTVPTPGDPTPGDPTPGDPTPAPSDTGAPTAPDDPVPPPSPSG